MENRDIYGSETSLCDAIVVEVHVILPFVRPYTALQGEDILSKTVNSR